MVPRWCVKRYYVVALVLYLQVSGRKALCLANKLARQNFDKPGKLFDISVVMYIMALLLATKYLLVLLEATAQNVDSTNFGNTFGLSMTPTGSLLVATDGRPFLHVNSSFAQAGPVYNRFGGTATAGTSSWHVVVSQHSASFWTAVGTGDYYSVKRSVRFVLGATLNVLVVGLLCVRVARLPLFASTYANQSRPS